MQKKMVKAFFENFKHQAQSFGRRVNNVFNHVKVHARNALPFVRKAAILAQGVNRYANLPYVDVVAKAVHSGTHAAEGLLDRAENVQRHWGLPTHTSIFR